MTELERRSRIAAVLKGARKERKYTVQETAGMLLARGLPIAEKTLYGWETGKRQPDADALLMLCDVYGIKSFSAFFTAENDDYFPGRLSRDARELAQTYDNLDRFGRLALKRIAAVEKDRCFGDDSEESAPLDAPKVIQLYLDGAAAGPLMGITGQASEDYTLGKDDPQNAVYAVRVSGDSMEPLFYDGDIAFVSMEPVNNGDIGIFCVDGANLIKQYFFDPIMQMTYLFSLNRARADMDQVIPQNGSTLVCQGKVITKRHFPLPGIANKWR